MLIVSSMNCMQSTDYVFPCKFKELNSLGYFICIFRGIRKSHITFFAHFKVLGHIALFYIRQFVFCQIYHSRKSYVDKSIM